MKSGNFFSELKRRNVYKVAVAYAVIGWLVMQVASTIVPALHLPETITTAVVVLTLLGFPIALVLAWAFELTPEGIKRAEDTTPGDYSRRPRTHKFTAFVASIAILAAAGLTLIFSYGVRILIARPLHEIAEASRKLAAGNLEQRYSLERQSLRRQRPRLR